MEPDWGQTEFLTELAEPVGEVLGAYRPPVSVGEHRPSLPPAWAGAVAGVGAMLLGELVLEQFEGLLDGLAGQPSCACLVQGDGADAGAALGRPAVQLARQGHELPGDGQLAGLGVQVVTVQGGGLTAAQAAQRNQPPQRHEPVVFHSGQESDQLAQGPDRDRRADAVPSPGLDTLGGPDDRVRTDRLVQPDLVQRVAGNEALADGRVQR